MPTSGKAKQRVSKRGTFVVLTALAFAAGFGAHELTSAESKPLDPRLAKTFWDAYTDAMAVTPAGLKMKARKINLTIQGTGRPLTLIAMRADDFTYLCADVSQLEKEKHAWNALQVTLSADGRSIDLGMNSDHAAGRWLKPHDGMSCVVVVPDFSEITWISAKVFQLWGNMDTSNARLASTFAVLFDSGAELPSHQFPAASNDTLGL